MGILRLFALSECPIQRLSVSVQFTVGTHTGTATLPFDGAMATAKVGALDRVGRQWNRTVQETTVTYTLDTAASRCYSQEQQQADWNITDPASPGYIHHKPTLPELSAMMETVSVSTGEYGSPMTVLYTKEWA